MKRTEVKNVVKDYAHEPTGKEFIYSTSTLLEISRVGKGVEGKVYRATVEDESGEQWWFAIKKFSAGTIAEQIDECRKTSQLAHHFREEGLPVLPMVKSITSFKERTGPPRTAWEYFLELLKKRRIQPPFVLMTFLGGQNKQERVLDFSPNAKDFDALCEELSQQLPVMEDMVKDLATIHRLGYAFGWVSSNQHIERHPVTTAWHFTHDEQGNLRRWIVDVSNLSPIDAVQHGALHIQEGEFLDLMELFAHYVGPKFDEVHFTKLYTDTYHHSTQKVSAR